MAFDIQELKEKAVASIVKHKLFFMEDVIVYLPCGRTTFYDTYKLNQEPEIIEALEKNRIEIKVAMRSKWFNSDHPALQIGLYKLIGSDAEADRLGNKQKLEHSSDENNPLTINIIKSDITPASSESEVDE
jgi:hypothetical protein